MTKAATKDASKEETEDLSISASQEPGEDPTEEGWKPAWLVTQEKAAQVPINVYAEVQAATFAEANDAVFTANVPDETPADATESADK
jgi:hypothetical protein